MGATVDGLSAIRELKAHGVEVYFDLAELHSFQPDFELQYGSINLLSFGSSQESMMRLVSGSIAHELMKTEAFNENR